jgi:hypothetical protein
VRLSINRRERRSSAYGITTADGSHLDDVTRRQKQYAVTMAFRVVAILVVVLVPGLSVMERVILGLVATIIPYVAVIRANGGADTAADPTNLMVGGPRQPELPIADRSIGGTYVDGAETDDAEAEPDGADADLDAENEDVDPDHDRAYAAADEDEESQAGQGNRPA